MNHLFKVYSIDIEQKSLLGDRLFPLGSSQSGPYHVNWLIGGID